MGPLLEGLLRSLGGSEANFLELCFGRLPYGNFHTKATSKKSRPPSGNFRPNPPELPRSPSRSGSSQEAGRKIVLKSLAIGNHNPEGPTIKKFDLDRDFQSRSKFLIFKLENFNLDVSISPRKIGSRWVARSKISFLDRNFQSRSKSRIFLIFGPSGNFEVASFSRRNRSKIAMSQSQKSHWTKKIAAIRNHTLVVATYSGGFPDPCGDSETL